MKIRGKGRIVSLVQNYIAVYSYSTSPVFHNNRFYLTCS